MQTRRKTIMPIGLAIGVFLIFGLIPELFKTNNVQAGLADHVVINEIQIDGIVGAGGTNDDWVELYNPTAGDIILDGWSIQKHAQASSSSISKAALAGLIPAGGYFLIVRSSATTTLTEIADIISSNLALANNNTVYLVDDNINIENQDDLNIVDYVGMGNAESYEGAGAALNPDETESIVRAPDGEDTDNNNIDFVVQVSPTPQNSEEDDDGVDGTVLVTITPNAQPVQNFGPASADIVFQVNSDGMALVNYGLDDSYGSSTALDAVLANMDKTISLTGLACETVYHYSIYAENAGATDTATTSDATFTTLPCGIVIDSLVMTETEAKANDEYADGWEWVFDITVWDMSEDTLKIKFDQWSGTGALDAGGNMQFSVNAGADWLDITDNGAYPVLGADISGIDEDLGAAGRQVEIIVRMKVPVGTLAGSYNSSYGILTE